MNRILRISLALATVAVLAAVAGTWLALRAPAGAMLVVEDARRGQVLLQERVSPGDRFTLSYLHSVSKTEVSGRFEVAEDGALVARETSFGTFGPGLPELTKADRYEVKDGLIRQFDLDQRLLELSVFVHPYTEHRLEVRGRVLELSKTLPPGTLVRIRAGARR